jgi:hypothetical protein
MLRVQGYEQQPDANSKRYASNYIFSVENMTPVYNVQPDRTSTIEGELCCRDNKHKAGTSLLLCCNAHKRRKLMYLIVGTFESHDA